MSKSFKHCIFPLNCCVLVDNRYSVLDVILQAIEAFSVVDDFSIHMSCNEDLFHLVEELIKLPDKTEVPFFSENCLCIYTIHIITN